MAKGVKGSGLPREEKPIRTSYSLQPTTIKKVRYIAAVEGPDMSSIVDNALQIVINEYEKKNGPIPVK